MQFKSVKELIEPLLKGGIEWQNISINGADELPPGKKYSQTTILLFILSILFLFLIPNGLSSDLIGYVIAAFSISVSLFMSLLVSIFDKFENTQFDTHNKIKDEIDRLKQKKNFFKKFISVTSYLVILSIVILILCGAFFVIPGLDKKISVHNLTYHFHEIDFKLTFKNIGILVYRFILFFMLLNYLLLTAFITASAYDYYISEINNKKIE